MSENTLDEVLSRLLDIEKKIDNMSKSVEEISRVTESFASAEDIVSLKEAEKARDFIGSFVSDDSGGLEGMLDSFKNLRSRMSDLSERISDVDEDSDEE